MVSLSRTAPGAGIRDRVVGEVRHRADRAAIYRRWRAGWRPCGGRPEVPGERVRGAACPARSNSSSGAVALEPGLELLQVLGVVGRIRERHLVRTKRAFDRQAIDDFGARPTLGRLEDKHWPHWPSVVTAFTRVALNLPEAREGLVQRGRHGAMHELGLVAAHEMGS